MSIDKKAFGLSDSLISAVSEALKGGQVKIDKNHNGKIDGQDFKMLRKEEDIDEKAVSKAQQHAAGAALATQRGEYDGGKKGGAINRMASMKTSELRKFAGTKTKGLPTHKEEVEQVDELSKKTMGSYIKKASHDVATKSAATGRYADRANAVKDQMKKGDYSNYQQGKKDDATADKMFNKSWKRRAGIAKATDKLTKEETLDEIQGTYGNGGNKKNLKIIHKGVVVKDYGTDTKPNKASRDKMVAKAEKMKAYRANRDKNMEEEIQIDEISKGTLASYGYKAGRQMQGNQPSDPDKFRKRTNREKGSKLAYGKYYGHKVKVPATEEAESVDELSKNTLGNYALAGVRDIASRQYALGKGDKSNTGKLMNRRKGVDKAISKLTKEETDPGFAEAKTMTKVKTTKDIGYKVVDVGPGQKEKIVKAHNWTEPKKKLPNGADYAAQRRKERLAANGRMDEASENPMAKQLADKKAAIQKTIVQKKMQVMQSKANKQMSSMKEGKCSCTEGKKSMTCETHGDKAMGMKGGKEPILMNPPLRD
jgi:hypothetical protein